MRPEDLLPHEICETVSRAFRIRRVGTTFLVENRQQTRDVVDGVEKVEDVWKVVAVSKPDLARPGKTPMQEAYDFMNQADERVAEMVNMRRAGVPNGASARPPNQGNA